MDFLDEKLADLRGRLQRLQHFKRHDEGSRTVPPDIEDDLKKQIAEVLRLMAERKK